MFEKNADLVEKILQNEGIKEQIKEWQELGIVDENFKVDDIFTSNLMGKYLSEKYQHLPIDTKYFKDLELEILNQFDDLDRALDGWLIKSENYQALNTILPKFKEKVQTIYIDPPYNTGSDEFIYKDRFMHSSWLSMMQNRLDLSAKFLKKGGVFFSSIANNAKYYNESAKLNLLLESIFSQRMGELIWKRRSGSGSNTIQGITEMHEYILCFGNEETDLNKNILTQEDLKKYTHEDEKGVFKWNDTVINQYTKKQRPNLYYPVLYDVAEDRIFFDNSQTDSKNIIKIYPSENGNSVFFCDINSMKEIHKRGILKVFKENGEYKLKIKKYLYNADGTINGNIVKSVLEKDNTQFNIGGTSQGTRELKDMFNKETFKNPKPSNLISLLIYISTRIKDEKNYILDFFAGSGTTAHAVMKLNKEDGGNRKFILVEMADYFDTVIIPRIKKLSYSFDWKNGQPKNTDGLGIFFKYYELEQYEETLANCK
ncbi:MAG TPA: site-specific DNA-methyltransferase, partial [Candidatus Paceibacterota bacterium]|nr:site-specific DNA-methyltransferase [Candidatus Paceibacterota bacterium]